MASRNSVGSVEEKRSSRAIHQEIEETREDMDHTLDELGERLHPKHLLEDVIDVFRSDGGGASASTQRTRQVARRLVRKVKQHPIPALLCGGGLAWLLLEDEQDPRQHELRRQWDDLPEYSGSFVDARTGEPYTAAYGEPWSGAAAWHDRFDWSDTHEDEQSWSERAGEAVEAIQKSLSDTKLGAQEKLRASAAKLMAVSGRRRSEIREQWANLPEHSGSFVDARTGEPYDDSYGEEWRELACCDIAAREDWSDEDEGRWGDKARETISRMQQSLGDTKMSTKERLNTFASHISDFVSQTQDVSSRYGNTARRSFSRAAGASRHAAARAGRASRRGARAAGDRATSGYHTARDFADEAMEEHPLAVGAAVLGAGLIAGLLLPRTRREDRLMGTSADRLKRKGRDTGAEALERGEQVAQSAASTAMDEAEQQGLTPQQLGDQARHAAGRVQDVAQEELPASEAVRQKVEKVAERTAETAQQESRAHAGEAQSRADT